MLGGSNFIYSVISGGIGGVHCGGEEGGTRIYTNKKDTLINQDLYSALMEDLGVSLDLGYLELIPNKIATKKKKQHYALTTKAIKDKHFILLAKKKE